MGEKELGLGEGAASQRISGPREAGSGMATGRTAGASTGGEASGIAIDESGVHRSVAAADVDGDGMTDRLQTPRETGTGQASGIAIGDPGVNGNFTDEPAGLAVSDPGVPNEPSRPKSK